MEGKHTAAAKPRAFMLDAFRVPKVASAPTYQSKRLVFEFLLDRVLTGLFSEVFVYH